MNKKRVIIALAVLVALVWGAVATVKAVRTPRVDKAPVAIEQPVAKIEAPYVVTKTEPAFTAPAAKCVADPKLLPKKVQPKTKIAPAAVPQPQTKPTAVYRKVLGQPVLLPN